jgi:hypothetical protein
MKTTHKYTVQTEAYRIEDGPVVKVEGRRRVASHFRVELLTLDYLNGDIREVFVRGTRLDQEGNVGTATHQRRFGANELPEWVKEFINEKERNSK